MAKIFPVGPGADIAVPRIQQSNQSALNSMSSFIKDENNRQATRKAAQVGALTNIYEINRSTASSGLKGLTPYTAEVKARMDSERDGIVNTLISELDNVGDAADMSLVTSMAKNKIMDDPEYKQALQFEATLEAKRADFQKNPSKYDVNEMMSLEKALSTAEIPMDTSVFRDPRLINYAGEFANITSDIDATFKYDDISRTGYDVITDSQGNQEEVLGTKKFKQGASRDMLYSGIERIIASNQDYQRAKLQAGMTVDEFIQSEINNRIAPGTETIPVTGVLDADGNPVATSVRFETGDFKMTGTGSAPGNKTAKQKKEEENNLIIDAVTGSKGRTSPGLAPQRYGSSADDTRLELKNKKIEIDANNKYIGDLAAQDRYVPNPKYKTETNSYTDAAIAEIEALGGNPKAFEDFRDNLQVLDDEGNYDPLATNRFLRDVRRQWHEQVEIQGAKDHMDEVHAEADPLVEDKLKQVYGDNWEEELKRVGWYNDQGRWTVDEENLQPDLMAETSAPSPGFGERADYGPRSNPKSHLLKTLSEVNDIYDNAEKVVDEKDLADSARQLPIYDLRRKSGALEVEPLSRYVKAAEQSFTDNSFDTYSHKTGEIVNRETLKQQAQDDFSVGLPAVEGYHRGINVFNGDLNDHFDAYIPMKDLQSSGKQTLREETKDSDTWEVTTIEGIGEVLKYKGGINMPHPYARAVDLGDDFYEALWGSNKIPSELKGHLEKLKIDQTTALNIPGHNNPNSTVRRSSSGDLQMFYRDPSTGKEIMRDGLDMQQVYDTHKAIINQTKDLENIEFMDLVAIDSETVEFNQLSARAKSMVSHLNNYVIDQFTGNIEITETAETKDDPNAVGIKIDDPKGAGLSIYAALVTEWETLMTSTNPDKRSSLFNAVFGAYKVGISRSSDNPDVFIITTLK